MTWKRIWTPHVGFFLGPDQRLGGWVAFLYQRDKLWVQTAFCIHVSQQCCKEMMAKELSLWACCPPYSRAERASQGSESPILESSLPSTPPFPLWCVPSLQLLIPSHLPLAHFIQEPFPKPSLQADLSVTADAWGGGFFIILSPTPAATGARHLHLHLLPKCPSVLKKPTEWVLTQCSMDSILPSTTPTPGSAAHAPPKQLTLTLTLVPPNKLVSTRHQLWKKL